MTIKILGVQGSLRSVSYCASALETILNQAQERYGAEVRVLDLRRHPLPIFLPDDTSARNDAMVQSAREHVSWADCFVLATPDYHGSMSGAMKNFLDHFWTEYAGKLFAYVCASHEKGLTAMDQMRTVVRQCYGWSLPYGVAIDSDADFDAQMKLTNERVRRRLHMLARDVTVYGHRISEQFTEDLASDETETFVARYRKQ